MPLPPAVQAIINRANAGNAQATSSPVAASPAQQPPPFDPNVMPPLNSIPDQSQRGPQYLPWNEPYDIRTVLHQIRHRAPSARSGPRFEAIFEITRVDLSPQTKPILVGTTRALAWFYNPGLYPGKEKDKSDRNLRRFKEFVAGISGQTGIAGFDADAMASQLVSTSTQVPSLGIPIRLINTEDGTSKETGKTFFVTFAFLVAD
jgi:hypothetical protein